MATSDAKCPTCGHALHDEKCAAIISVISGENIDRATWRLCGCVGAPSDAGPPADPGSDPRRFTGDIIRVNEERAGLIGYLADMKTWAEVHKGFGCKAPEQFEKWIELLRREGAG